MLHRDVADGVHRIGEHFLNWYLVEEGGRLTVVDAGLPASWRSLLGALEGIGRAPGDIEALVLTHAHFDHIGFAERARAELSIPVWVHESDVPLTKRPWLYMSERSPFAYLGRKTLPIVASFVRAGAPRVGPIREVRRFGDEGTLDLPGSPRVLFTPGHTLGHVALHLPERDTVITGDALVTHDIYTDIRGPRIVARGATADSERALASLDRLGAREPGRSCPATVSLGQMAPSRLLKKPGGRPLTFAGPSQVLRMTPKSPLYFAAVKGLGQHLIRPSRHHSRSGSSPSRVARNAGPTLLLSSAMVLRGR